MKHVVVMAAILILSTAPVMASGGLPIINVPLGGEKVTLEVAATGTALERGLQGRTALPENAGMLFVLPDAALRCLWMKDTVLPLSAAYLDAAGAVVTLVDMAPLSPKFHCGAASARYVLEMNRGWFMRHGVAVGARVDLKGLHKNGL